MLTENIQDMEKIMDGMRDDLEEAKTKAEILLSTLIALYTAQERNSYDSAVYAEAIYGTIHWSSDLVKIVDNLLSCVLK